MPFLKMVDEVDKTLMICFIVHYTVSWLNVTTETGRSKRMGNGERAAAIRADFVVARSGLRGDRPGSRVGGELLGALIVEGAYRGDQLTVEVHLKGMLLRQVLQQHGRDVQGIFCRGEVERGGAGAGISGSRVLSKVSP